MKHVIVAPLISILTSATGLFAQENDSVQSFEFREEDPRIAELADRYNRTNELHGYRIQILSSSKKEAARKIKSKFVSKYDHIVAYEMYQQPFFIVKVGDFITKLEAEKFHREIKEDFPQSYLIPDVITPYRQYSGSGN